jgi:hypothetical protein
LRAVRRLPEAPGARGAVAVQVVPAPPRARLLEARAVAGAGAVRLRAAILCRTSSAPQRPRRLKPRSRLAVAAAGVAGAEAAAVVPAARRRIAMIAHARLERWEC